MAAAIYMLCALTSLTCTYLLFRSYAANRIRLLLWTGICFAGFTVNNSLLVLDLIVYPDVNFYFVRIVPAVIGMFVLIFGFIGESI